MGTYDKIKSYTKPQGITITSIEKELGISNGSISKWNIVSPTAKTLKKVADFLAVPIEALIGD